MNQIAFAAACLLGLGIAGAVTLEATEPRASMHASALAASATPVASETPPAVASAEPAASAEPVMVGFDGGSLAEVPQLELAPPASAPKGVRFGVVLVVYANAQGAAPNARSKAEAQALATRLAQQAQGDFKAAVAGGDPGSMEDAGRISRGTLEAEAESVLFQLEVGAVSAPIDTPRGYWIVKRIE